MSDSLVLHLKPVSASVRGLLSILYKFLVYKNHELTLSDATVLCSSSLEFPGTGKICKTF